MYLAGPPDARLDLKRPLSIKMLADLPLILLAPQNRLRRRIETELEKHGLTLATGLEVEGQPLVLDLIRNGVGYTVLPYCAIEAEMAAGRISGAPIRDLSIWSSPLGGWCQRGHLGRVMGRARGRE